jgi:N-acyl-phosphatidylethanolamine-hydrolysing phospholipase D
VDGLNILTDLVFGDRIGANRTFSVKRYVAPGLALGELPIVDVILISHNHFDYLDLPSLEAIVK